VVKGYKNLAIQLHKGKDVCLSKLILGSLYESLNQAVVSIKEYQLGGSLIIPGPIWLFQLWLLATFRKKLGADVFLPTDFQEQYTNRPTEGTCLALLRYRSTNSKELFTTAYEALLNCDVFIPALAPFSSRTCGPDWFTREFPVTKVEDEVETNAIWQAYLTPTLLSCRSSASKTSYSFGVSGYQPNLVVRQFSLVQPKLGFLYKFLNDLKMPTKEHTWRTLLQQAQEHTPAFTHVPFSLSYSCTEAFFRW